MHINYNDFNFFLFYCLFVQVVFILPKMRAWLDCTLRFVFVCTVQRLGKRRGSSLPRGRRCGSGGSASTMVLRLHLRWNPHWIPPAVWSESCLIIKYYKYLLDILHVSRHLRCWDTWQISTQSDDSECKILVWTAWHGWARFALSRRRCQDDGICDVIDGLQYLWRHNRSYDTQTGDVSSSRPSHQAKNSQRLFIFRIYHYSYGTTELLGLEHADNLLKNIHVKFESEFLVTVVPRRSKNCH